MKIINNEILQKGIFMFFFIFVLLLLPNKVSAAETHTVTFHGNGGTVYNSDTFQVQFNDGDWYLDQGATANRYNLRYVTLALARRPNYWPVGWATSQERANNNIMDYTYYKSFKVKKDLDLWCIWAPVNNRDNNKYYQTSLEFNIGIGDMRQARDGGMLEKVLQDVVLKIQSDQPTTMTRSTFCSVPRNITLAPGYPKNVPGMNGYTIESSGVDPSKPYIKSVEIYGGKTRNRYLSNTGGATQYYLVPLKCIIHFPPKWGYRGFYAGYSVDNGYYSPSISPTEAIEHFNKDTGDDIVVYLDVNLGRTGIYDMVFDYSNQSPNFHPSNYYYGRDTNPLLRESRFIVGKRLEINYDGNGSASSPSMNPKIITSPGTDDGLPNAVGYNAPFTLDANKFKKIGYTFKGWSKTPYTNKVEFTDSEEFADTYDKNIINYPEEDSTTLYAVWQRTGGGFIQLPISHTDMFTNDVNLVGGHGTTYNSEWVDGRRAHIDGNTPQYYDPETSTLTNLLLPEQGYFTLK